MLNLNHLDPLKEVLSTPRRLSIVTHWSPDGDAMGSSLGLANFLINTGHTVKVVVPNDYPEFLWWMKGNSDVINAEKEFKKAEEALNGSELIFCLDFNDLNRINSIGKLVSALDTPKVLIDHHPQPSEFAKYILHDVKSSSTCELIYDLIVYLDGVKHVDKDIAECLYAGIMTDTGSFRFPSTTAKTFRVAADLVERGANHSETYNRIYDENTESRLRLLGYSLSEKLSVFPDYHAACFSLSDEDHHRFNYKKGDTEGLVNYALTIKGIKFSAFFAERDGVIKCSFRSKGSFDVNLFAREHFNGGGHRNAAGGASKESLEEVVKKFKSLLPQYESQLKSS